MVSSVLSLNFPSPGKALAKSKLSPSQSKFGIGSGVDRLQMHK